MGCPNRGREGVGVAVAIEEVGMVVLVVDGVAEVEEGLGKTRLL